MTPSYPLAQKGGKKRELGKCILCNLFELGKKTNLSSIYGKATLWDFLMFLVLIVNLIYCSTFSILGLHITLLLHIIKRKHHSKGESSVGSVGFVDIFICCLTSCVLVF